jgi:hypothetical protein
MAHLKDRLQHAYLQKSVTLKQYTLDFFLNTTQSVRLVQFSVLIM